jgi:hypothetical protein
VERDPKGVLQSGRLLFPKRADYVHWKKRKRQSNETGQEQARSQDQILQASLRAGFALDHFWKSYRFESITRT